MSKLYRLFLFSFLFLGLSACKKDSSDPEPNDQYYNISFKLDGVKKEFKSNAKIQIGIENGYYFLYAIANETMPGKRITFYITGVRNDIIAPFTFSATAQPGSLVGRMVYEEDSYAQYAALTTARTPEELDYRFNVTERTDKYVKGKFSGTVHGATPVTIKNKLAITEGTFYLEVSKLR